VGVNGTLDEVLHLTVHELPLKENIQQFKTMHSFTFSFYLGLIGIRIPKDPDDQNYFGPECGSGSTTSVIYQVQEWNSCHLAALRQLLPGWSENSYYLAELKQL
jgi:hypothetical protein